MGIDESLLREIVRRVLSVTKPDRIIIFGSAATGQMSRDSDIDLKAFLVQHEIDFPKTHDLDELLDEEAHEAVRLARKVREAVQDAMKGKT